jgi:ABC-type phosphate transport system substrate-binding protein
MPQPDTIMAGGYPITRFFYVLTGAPGDVPDEALQFIDFLTGPRGDELVEANGYLPAP